MSVSSHLGIALSEYDARIRTFIPDYEEMLAAGAAAVPAGTRRIVDLGIGTGAFAARCLAGARRASVVGIDEDEAMVPMAARRLGSRAQLVAGSFLRVDLPRCDAIVASFALHHVRTRPPKARLYQRISRALRPGGVFVTVDCHPSRDRRMASEQRLAWLAHLRKAYGTTKARAFLSAWANEDVYVPLDAELDLMERADLRPDVLWRRGAFAVVRAVRRTGQ